MVFQHPVRLPGGLKASATIAIGYAGDFVVVRRQRVQILRRTGMPSKRNVLFWMLALNVRLVRGALRSHRPECLCRILRP